MSSPSTPRRGAPRQGPPATAPSSLVPQAFYSPYAQNSPQPMQYPTQGFPPYAPPPPHQQPQHIQSHMDLQPRPASPSRKRKAPGAAPEADPSAMASVGLGDTSGGGEQQGTGPGTSPTVSAPKKSRTNTPWTPAEEQRLRELREVGNSWGEIAKSFPARTEGSVKKHWYKDMHYAEFAEDESQALLNAIKEYEASKWKVIGQKVGKPAKACEQYAKEHFGGKI